MTEQVPDMFGTKPRWCWTGVAQLNFPDQNSKLQFLVAMLPTRQSGDDEVLAYLAELSAHFQRWLHQDEFGPNRSQQSAAIRALVRSIQNLQRQLVKGSSLLKGRLDVALRSQNDPSSSVMEALYEAAADVEYELRIVGAPAHEVMWVLRFRNCVETLMAEAHSVDTNTDGEIFFSSLGRRFDPSQATGLDFGLANVERWLNGYWNVLGQTLSKLNGRRGAAERVSLKLLVEQLCKFWERETGCRVTAHGVVKDEYTGRTETKAGRFITAAVEAMLPDPPWFKEHAEFAHSFRAKTFLPDDQGHREQRHRARQILVIMRNFVKRRPKRTT